MPRSSIKTMSSASASTWLLTFCLLLFLNISTGELEYYPDGVAESSVDAALKLARYLEAQNHHGYSSFYDQRVPMLASQPMQKKHQLLELRGPQGGEVLPGKPEMAGLRWSEKPKPWGFSHQVAQPDYGELLGDIGPQIKVYETPYLSSIRNDLDQSSRRVYANGETRDDGIFMKNVDMPETNSYQEDPNLKLVFREPAEDVELNERLKERLTKQVKDQLDERMKERLKEEMEERLDERMSERLNEEMKEQLEQKVREIDEQVKQQIKERLHHIKDEQERMRQVENLKQRERQQQMQEQNERERQRQIEALNDRMTNELERQQRVKALNEEERQRELEALRERERQREIEAFKEQERQREMEALNERMKGLNVRIMEEGPNPHLEVRLNHQAQERLNERIKEMLEKENSRLHERLGNTERVNGQLNGHKNKEVMEDTVSKHNRKLNNLMENERIKARMNEEEEGLVKPVANIGVNEGIKGNFFKEQKQGLKEYMEEGVKDNEEVESNMRLGNEKTKEGLSQQNEGSNGRLKNKVGEEVQGTLTSEEIGEKHKDHVKEQRTRMVNDPMRERLNDFVKIIFNTYTKNYSKPHHEFSYPSSYNKPEFTYHFDNTKVDNDEFAVRPNDPRYYDDSTPAYHLIEDLEHLRKQETNKDNEEEGETDNSDQAVDQTAMQVASTSIHKFQSGNKDVMPEPERRAEYHPVVVPVDQNMDSDIYFIAIVAGCSAAAMFALVLISLTCWRLQRGAKAAADIEYPAYGVTGPNKDISPSGDQRLAQSAQMYHFQHQKQQIIAMEKSSATRDPGSVSEAESDDEENEGDYTVYECPGLAPTGEMEVKNPLFHDDPTPATPAQTS
ncbi:zinc finger CCCH domain-containing protein 13 [Prorops nasuta]|uniref:zinc finger CCCH domain-containing protein 13 n=1 Tax=Prorops nasuta TaxID=863751 RepID=UPI0034CF8FB9